MTLEDFASKNFQPLGMTHTTYRDDHTMLIPHRALAYDPKEKDNGGYKLNVSYFEQLGDGAVHTSVEDLAKWDENFYSGQVGGKAFLAELQQRGKLNNGKTLDYAKGLFIQTYRGLPVARHGGAWGGYRAELLRFPQQHFSVACLCNLSNANPEKRANEVADVVLGSLLKPAEHAENTPSQAATEVSLSRSDLQRFTGTYRDPETRNIARIAENKGKLELEIYGQKFGLRALSPTQFLPLGIPVDAELNFESGANHAVTGMKVTGDEELAASYDRVTDFLPSADELQAYAGDYLSDELGVIYNLRVVDGNLKLTGATDTLGIPRTGITPVALRPTIQDEFELIGAGVTVDFARNAEKAVSGFSLDAGRTRGIEFVRSASQNRVR